ncbi:helix-turn-helix domain-containing protein [Burkholderia gladioli]|jgi:CRP/FNR family transcriptional regulator|uniref:helix-turn-helix domain-containing protein n=1 Tax=Burkholderia gladioli TaxID=28095 RepID=UPI000626F47F|nr:helix-turn-helix domain-containing protein [Burkholderia gladioli]KAF1058137.1 Fumarate and nitrate reduction regulatory protein [Burkholderia gladioli]KKJ02403.1 Crp/Fnr family transcriptional regulator [Burkholderia gladioli]MBU9645130.1 helix-turn-helix domain-containing protein [Burkholderia gladioli]MDN7497204.1 helix-turn-helix domain-containing protein [Burkholderia gladioli]MDN7598461.1 helix-turn-helix domain-containing protein [Burkholderia gladioli]
MPTATTPATIAHDVPPPAAVPFDAPKQPGARCSNCATRNVCMPSALTHAEYRRLDALICTTRQVKRGDALFHAEDPFTSLYAVRSGSFKTVVMHRDGREQVTGFQITGETLGLDGVCEVVHHCDAIALEDSTVCVIPFAQLEAACREMRLLQQHVHQLLAGEIVRESRAMMLLGTMTAEQRVASFLLNLSARFKARGYSPAEFNLRMTREEIGCYLGMTLETVSRMLSKFQRNGLIDSRGRQIRINDAQGLVQV